MILPRRRTTALPKARIQINTDAALWRGRVMRYMLIYLLMAVTLVITRHFTQDIRPTLRNLEQQEGQLITELHELEIAYQAKVPPQKIKKWARENNMVPFANAYKEKQSFEPGVLLPKPIYSHPKIEVEYQWR